MDKFSREYLASKIPMSVLKIIKTLQNDGYESYIVGGCVRDIILNKKPHDFDICTNAKPEKVINIFNKNGYKLHKKGIDYGTINLIIGKEEYEVTTYRNGKMIAKSNDFSDNINEDLLSRDFTINAIAIDPYNSKSHIIDLSNGLKDIEFKEINAVGNANDRFIEDPLRILRAIRLSVQLGFKINEKVKKAMFENKELLLEVSKERITSEFIKMFSSGLPFKDEFIEYVEILKVIIPEIEPCIGFNQNNRFHKHNVYEHMLFVMDGCKTNDYEIKFAAFLHDIGKPHSYTVSSDGSGHFYGHPEVSYKISKKVLANNFSLPKKSMDRILELVLYHDMFIPNSRKIIKKELSIHGRDMLFQWLILKKSDIEDHVNQSGARLNFYNSLPYIKRQIESIIKENECFSVKDLKVSGNDLLEMGMNSGKSLGDMLNLILENVIDETLENNREDLIAFVKERLEITE